MPLFPYEITGLHNLKRFSQSIFAKGPDQDREELKRKAKSSKQESDPGELSNLSFSSFHL